MKKCRNIFLYNIIRIRMLVTESCALTWPPPCSPAPLTSRNMALSTRPLARTLAQPARNYIYFSIKIYQKILIIKFCFHFCCSACVIVRDDLLNQSHVTCPGIINYKSQANSVQTFLFKHSKNKIQNENFYHKHFFYSRKYASIRIFVIDPDPKYLQHASHLRALFDQPHPRAPQEHLRHSRSIQHFYFLPKQCSDNSTKNVILIWTFKCLQ